MKLYNSFAEIKTLLLAPINMRGHTVKDISAATDLKVDTPYKRETTEVYLSPFKTDAFLIYFIQNEPKRLELAETVLAAKNNIL